MQELGNCSDTHPPPYSIQECKATCLATPNCGGFNLPNGHLKKLGCMEEMQPWTSPPHSHPLNLYVLNEYAPQRNYWWRVENFDCNPGIVRCCSSTWCFRSSDGRSDTSVVVRYSGVVHAGARRLRGAPAPVLGR